MTIATPTEVAFISTGGTASSYSTASGLWTPVASRGYVAWVASALGTGPAIPTTFSGNGITWFLMASVLSGSGDRRESAYVAEGTGGTNGNTTADFGGISQTACNITIEEIASGWDLSTIGSSPGAGKSVVQAPTGADAGTGTTSTVNLAAAGNANNRVIACHYIKTGAAMTPRASWTEITEHATGGEIEVQFRTDAFEATSTATWTGASRWTAIALELLASGGGTVNPQAIALGMTLTPGMSRQTGKIFAVGATFAPAVSKQAAKALPLGATLSPAATKSVGKPLPIGVTLTPALGTIKAKQQLLNLTITLTPSFVKRTGKTLSLGVSFLPAFIRRIGKVLGLGATLTPVMTPQSSVVAPIITEYGTRSTSLDIGMQASSLEAGGSASSADGATQGASGEMGGSASGSEV